MLEFKGEVKRDSQELLILNPLGSPLYNTYQFSHVGLKLLAPQSHDASNDND
jgi:hypothetical protein